MLKKVLKSQLFQKTPSQKPLQKKLKRRQQKKQNKQRKLPKKKKQPKKSLKKPRKSWMPRKLLSRRQNRNLKQRNLNLVVMLMPRRMQLNLRRRLKMPRKLLPSSKKLRKMRL